MKYWLPLIVVLFMCSSSSGQDPWGVLGMVTYTSSYNEDLGMETLTPTVSEVTKAMDGKTIEVKGFIIPLSGKKAQRHFMLSKYPESTCFFCGAAGPETAMQVFMKDNKKVYYTTEKIKVSGTLRINATDASSLMYTLEDAVLIK